MNYFLCYLLVFATVIFVFEYIIPLERDTQEQVKEDFEMLKSMIKNGNASTKASIIIAICVYLFVVHLITIVLLSTIEWMAKLYYS